MVDEIAIRAEMERRVEAWLLKKLAVRNCTPKPLRCWRETKGWTQRELSQRSGFSRTASNIESGHRASVQTFECLAKVLSIPVLAITEYRQQYGGL